MKSLEELYYLVGRLECLKRKEFVRVTDLEFVRTIIDTNPYFQNEDEINSDIDDDQGYDQDENDYNDIDYDSYSDNEPYEAGDPRYDRNENPWIDVFGESDEAVTAYWNTD